MRSYHGLHSRIYLVEYLRGLAALSVAWFHLTNQYAAGISPARISGSYGWLGVEVFFVISGFVIPLSLAKLQTRYTLRQFPQFMVRRVLRLEPPYLISVALVIFLWLISALFPFFKGAPFEFNFGQIFAHLFYLIPLTDFDWIQPVYWSLAWEFIFYIVMGLIFPTVGRDDQNLTWCIAAIAVGLLTVSGFLPIRVLLFIIGVALYRVELVSSFIREDQRVQLVSNLIVILISGLIISREDMQIALVAISAAGLIHLFRRYEAPFFLHRWLIRLGACSYSLYLTHIPIGGRIVNLGRRFIDGALSEFILSMFALLVCLVFAWLFMLVVERPAIALSKTLGRKPLESVV